jgi:hypothetical protein
MLMDCSELDKLISQLAMNIATDPGVESLSDVVEKMKKLLPGMPITYEYVASAIDAATKRDVKESDEISKKLNEIKGEARSNVNLTGAIATIEEYIKTGTLPADASKKKAPFKIEQLRRTRDNLRRWLQTSDPAMEKKLGEELDSLNEQMASGLIDVKRRGELHEELQKIKDEIDSLRKQIRESKTKTALQKKLDTLKEHLEAGTLPIPKQKGITGDQETQELRGAIKDIRKEISRSAPAVQKRLEKSIAYLENKIETGDIFPKPKIEMATNKEIENLVYRRDMLKQEIRDEIRALKPLDFWGKAGVGIDFVRLWMTTGEFSFALRQGGIYAFTHPIKWSGAMVDAFKAFASPKALYKVNKEISERENAPNYLKSGLILITEGMSLSKTEEVIMNYWKDKLPVIRNFNRAAIAFMNKARADMFDAGYKTLSQNRQMTQDEMEIWANYINTMTGRGNLGKGRLSLEPMALVLNRFFFSPRYVASRFQIIGGAVKAPVMSIAGKNKMVYRRIAREYIRLATGVATVLGLGVLCGADIEEDPRSTDFGKLIFGKTRLDPLMGFGQTLTFLSRLLTGTTKSAGGKVYPIRPKNVFLYKDDFYTLEAKVQYGGKSVEDVFGQFLRSKMSPQMGMAWNIITGKNYMGKEITMLDSISQIAYPMTYGDVYDVMQEDGIPKNTALSLLTILGMGLQTYEGKETEYRVF